VCYRNWTVENAEQLGVKGWVRNRRDGSVEALFSDHLKLLMRYIRLLLENVLKEQRAM